MNRKFWWLFVTLVVCLPPRIAAQTPPLIDNLLIEVWPEYDRPEVLVIYQATLAPVTPLPTDVTIPLPAYVDDLHIVALVQNNSLVEVPADSFNLRREGNMAFLDLSVPVHTFQFEYYDPTILTREGETRILNYQFIAPYTIKAATFEVQEPFEASQFTSTPAVTTNFQGSDGLTYNTVQVEDLASGETFDLSATYQRHTDVLSIQNLANNDQEPSPTSPTPTVSTANDNRTLGYALVGVGALLFLAAIGSWWWSRRQSATPTRRRPISTTSRGKRSTATQTQPSQRVSSTGTAGFCYRCGTSLRRETNFCHHCGAERRQPS